jgi:hypothetical protein
LYHTNAEQAAIVTRFLHDALMRREKVLCITNPWDAGVYLRTLPHDEIDARAPMEHRSMRF